jgi:ribosomal protein L18
MIKRFNANNARLRRHQRMRSHFEGSPVRPRLNVFRSGKQIYAQIIDDTSGRTIVAASSLDESLHDFKPEGSLQEKAEDGARTAADKPAEVVEMAAEAQPVSKGKAAKTEKASQKAPAKGGPAGKGGKPGTQVKTVLPKAVKGEKRTPVEALVPIAHNRKVATAREVGKLVAQRAKEQGVSRVVFDRGGYAYHGRVAALAEGAREVGLEF